MAGKNDQTHDVYVAKIPADYTENQLKDLFSPVGQIKGARLMQGKGEHTHNYAFIKFATEADALCAVQYMNNYQIGDSKILVNYRKKEGSTSGNESGSSSSFGGSRTPSTRGGNFSSRGRGGSATRGRPSGFPSADSFQKTESLSNGFGSSNESYSNDDSGWDDGPEPVGKYSSLPSSSEEKPKEESVLVVHVEHPAKFWGQPICKENASMVQKVSSDLESECPNAPKVIGQLLSGQVFGCKFSVDQQWYRCKVEKQLPEQGTKMKIRYIDYGNCEVIDQSSLVQLSPSLSQIPPCAKEYTLDIKPTNADENSDKFIKDTDYLKELILEYVVKLTIPAGSSIVKATLDPNKDVAEDMIISGHAVANEKEKTEEKPAFGSTAKSLPPLRSPRNSGFPTATSTPMMGFPVTGLPGKQNDGLKSHINDLKSELQASKTTEEKLRMEIAMLKQKNIKLEQSVAKADAKLKQMSHSVVNEQFSKMIEEVDKLKQLRSDMHLEEDTPILRNAADLLTGESKCIKLDKLVSYRELLDTEAELSNLQTHLRNCANKDELGTFVRERDESRENYLNKIDKFLAEVKNLNFDERKKELEWLLENIQTKYEFTPSGKEHTPSVMEAVKAYESWKVKKIDDVKELQQNADLYSLTLANNLEILKLKISLKDEPLLVEIGDDASDYQNIDDMLDKFSKAVSNETMRVKDLNIDTEGKSMVSNLVESLVHSIREELDDIKSLRDHLTESYEEKKVEVEKWIKNKPDISKIKETRSLLKSLKSKFRHKQADRRDCEEDSDESDQLAKIEDEIELLRNQLHKVFIEEKRLLRELSHIAEDHFPELKTQHPDLGIATFLESNGLLQTRELEHYDHHSMPLISSSSSQPLVFKTKFNQKDCLIKEYSLDPQLTKDVIKSRMLAYAKSEHSSLVPLDALFFDKAGRKAFLQTPFYGDGNLKDYMETKPKEKELLSLLLGLLKAVASLHSCGYIHGSIMPHNVFIKKEETTEAVLGEPNFSKDETKRFSEVAAYSSSANVYPKFYAKTEPPSKELDAYCFGLLLFWAHFPDLRHNANALHMLKEVPKENQIHDLLERLLNEDPNQRMKLDDAINHTFFNAVQKRSQSPSEELMSALKDPGDSFAIIEMNESGDANQSHVSAEADDEKPLSQNEHHNENNEEEVFENSAEVKTNETVQENEEKTSDVGEEVLKNETQQGDSQPDLMFAE